MMSHYMQGEDNMWGLIRYNRLVNGILKPERKSPHYICEFESFKITGQKTKTLTLKVKPELKIEVNFHFA